MENTQDALHYLHVVKFFIKVILRRLDISAIIIV